MAQKKSQLPLMLGLLAAGGVGYYLYTAGGYPKVAEKQFEGTCGSIPSIRAQCVPESRREDVIGDSMS
jgi:hypothetical protein